MPTVTEEWGLCCPECKKDDRLDIALTAWARLTPGGTDIDAAVDASHDWDEDSACQCDCCGWHGTVKDAQVPE